MENPFTDHFIYNGKKKKTETECVVFGSEKKKIDSSQFRKLGKPGSE